MARALARLQAQFGAIPRLKGKGAGAAAVRGMLARMRREQGAAAPAAGAGPANALVHPGQGMGAAKSSRYLIAKCDSLLQYCPEYAMSTSVAVVVPDMYKCELG